MTVLYHHQKEATMIVQDLFALHGKVTKKLGKGYIRNEVYIEFRTKYQAVCDFSHSGPLLQAVVYATKIDAKKSLTPCQVVRLKELKNWCNTNIFI